MRGYWFRGWLITVAALLGATMGARGQWAQSTCPNGRCPAPAAPAPVAVQYAAPAAPYYVQAPAPAYWAPRPPTPPPVATYQPRPRRTLRFWFLPAANRRP